MISRRFADFLARLRRGGSDRDRVRLAAILELNRRLAASQDRGALLQILLDEAIALFEAERGFLILTEPGPATARDAATDDAGAAPAGAVAAGGAVAFRVELARSLDREPVKRPERKVSSTVVQRCLATRAGVFEEDAQTGELSAAQSVADLKLRSVLTTPLVVGDQCLGCIYLDHRFRGGAFGPDDLPWFEAFADQAAIALHLYALVDQTRENSRIVAAHNRELAARVAAQARELIELHGGRTRDALRHRYPAIVGESPAILQMLTLLDRVVDGDYPVVVVGESGTGKELVARAIHECGPRAGARFVALHVAAIAPQLLESELFGHVRGAFTGADRDRTGLLREADGGVVFLDEFTEMPLETQVKLLRVLEDRRVRPVGSDQETAIDVRVVAATNRDPGEAIRSGRLREDLYYRLAVVTLEVPALRERRSDVPALVEAFLAEAARAAGRVAPRRASREVLEELAARDWPGNVRELRNEVLRRDAMGTGEELGVGGAARAGRGEWAGGELELGKLERAAIDEALRRTGGNKAEAARMLGISRRALYNKLGSRHD